MGWLSAITKVVTTALPYVTSFVGGGISSVVNGVKNGQLDDDLSGVVGYPDLTKYAKAAGLDSPLDDNDRKGEECLVVTNEEITRRQAAQAILEQARIEHLVLEMPIDGLKKSEVIVTATYAFQFGPKLAPGTVVPEGITYVQPGDHVSFQLTPRKYNNFTQLTKHELIKFRSCRITSQLTSAYDSSTIVGYIPFVKNTQNINNTILGMLVKRVNLLPAEPLDFTIRYTSPALVEFDSRTGIYTPKTLFLEPNKVVRADYVKSLYNEQDNKNTMFSYGTVVVLKENTGEATISCKYKVEMNFEVWDYIDIGMDLEHAQQEWDDEHGFINGQTNDSTGSAPSRRRRGVIASPSTSN